MNLLETKLVILVTLGIVSFLVGLTTIPFRYNQVFLFYYEISNEMLCSKKILGFQNNVGRRQNILTSFLLCFGGGVLLSTSMLHILPETIKTLAEPGEQMDIDFLPQLVLCSGFFLIYLVEEVLQIILGFLNHSEPIHKSLSWRKSKHLNCAENESKPISKTVCEHPNNLFSFRTTDLSL